MIQINKEFEGFALYIDGYRTHMGNFLTIANLRKYWHENKRAICSGPKAIESLIWG